MNVAPPYANKKCWQREVEHAQKLHKDKLATIRPTSQTNSRTLLDFERPKTMDMTHVKNKSKKLLAEQHKLEKIQYENGLLLEKMQAIMRQDVGGPAVEFAPGVRLTRHQIPVTDTYVSGKTNMPGHALPVVSLGSSFRKREQARIFEENKALLDRITASKSVFDRTKWAKEREAEEKYISLIRKDDTNGYLPQSAVGHSVFYKSLPIDSAATLPSPSRPATRSGPLPALQTTNTSIRSKGVPVSPITGGDGGLGSSFTWNPDFQSFMQSITSVSTAHARPATTGNMGNSTRKGKNFNVSAGGSQSPHASSTSVNPVDFMTTQQAQSMLSGSVAVASDTTASSTPSELPPTSRPVASFRRVITVAGDDTKYRDVSVEIMEVPDETGGIKHIAVMCSLVSNAGVLSALTIPAPQLVGIADASDDVTLTAAVHRVRDRVAAESASHPSFVDAMTPDELRLLGVAVSQRVDVVLVGDALLVSLNAARADHGETVE